MRTLWSLMETCSNKQTTRIRRQLLMKSFALKRQTPPSWTKQPTHVMHFPPSRVRSNTHFLTLPPESRAYVNSLLKAFDAVSFLRLHIKTFITHNNKYCIYQEVPKHIQLSALSTCQTAVSCAGFDLCNQQRFSTHPDQCFGSNATFSASLASVHKTFIDAWQFFFLSRW